MFNSSEEFDRHLFSAVRTIVEGDGHVVVLTAKEADALAVELPLTLKLAAMEASRES